MSFIPGMAGVVAGGGLVALSAISVIGSNNSEESATISYPAIALQAGDVAIMFDYCGNDPDTGNVSTVVPAGFTSLANTQSDKFGTGPGVHGRARYIISYKILDGSETGSLTGMTDNDYEGKFLLIVRGNVPIVAVTLHDYSFQGSNGNPSSVVIDAADGTVPLLVFGEPGKSSPQAGFTSQSPAFATALDGNDETLLGYTVYNTSPINHTVDSDGAGLSPPGNLFCFLATGYIQFSGE